MKKKNKQLSKEWIKENGEQIKEIYDLATKRNFDIRSSEMVLELLKIVDPENANEEHADLLSKVLQLFGHQLKASTRIRKRSNNN